MGKQKGQSMPVLQLRQDAPVYFSNLLRTTEQFDEFERKLHRRPRRPARYHGTVHDDTLVRDPRRCRSHFGADLPDGWLPHDHGAHHTLQARLVRHRWLQAAGSSPAGHR